jgi:hypothetical protein
MIQKLRLVVALAAIAPIAVAAAAEGEAVKTTPAKGATYSGAVRDETITIKVAKNGRTATVKLPGAPFYCSGGSGPERESSKPGKIAKTGALTVKISYSAATGSDHAVFATVTVTGNFFTFGTSRPVFQGTAKTSFVAAGSRECDGETSFEAIKL